MIKPNELKHGNIIKTPYGEHKLYGVSPDCIQIDIEGVIYDFDLEDGEPIELNKQWLKDFGFFKYEKDCYQNKVLYMENGFTTLECDLKNKVFYVDNMELKLKYVHQLQNLIFSLTGEELTINQKTEA